VYALGPAATRRFLEFFTVHITNSHTRRAYAAAVGDFLLWCEAKSIQSLELVRERQIREYVSDLTQAQRISSVKQRLAALRHLFNWLANGRIMPNPATFVRIENTSYLPNSRMD
jgi:site-specific recombinase XerD